MVPGLSSTIHIAATARSSVEGKIVSPPTTVRLFRKKAMKSSPFFYPKDRYSLNTDIFSNRPTKNERGIYIATIDRPIIKAENYYTSGLV